MKEVLISSLVFIVGSALLVAIHIFIVRRLFGGVQPGTAVGLVHIPADSTARIFISVEELNSLPCVDRVGGGGVVDCAVCMESVEVGEKCRFLPNCGHYFHVACIDSWLLKNPVCPVCRACIVPTTSYQ